MRYRYLSRNEKVAAKYKENPTPPEQRLRDVLSEGVGGYQFQFQVPILNWIVDFYSPELNFGIEVDGNIHKFSINRRRDRERDGRLWDEAGVVIMRVAAAAIFQDIEGVVSRIEAAIKNVERLDRDSPLLRCKAKTTQVVQRTPEQKKDLIERLERRGKIEKRRYSPC